MVIKSNIYQVFSVWQAAFSARFSLICMHSLRTPLRQMLPLTLIDGQTWGIKRLSDLFMVTELGGRGAEFEPKRDRVTGPLSVRARLRSSQSPAEQGMKNSWISKKLDVSKHSRRKNDIRQQGKVAKDKSHRVGNAWIKGEFLSNEMESTEYFFNVS